MAKKTEKTILVTGATGHQGGAVLRQLRDKKGFAVRALARDPNSASARALVGHGTEVVRGDLDDLASLTRALDGVDGVYAVQSAEHGAEAEVRQGVNLIDAAARFRITQFVYSSVGSADKDTGIPHFDSKFRIEERLRASGLQHTILRPVFFMENWLNMRDRINEGALAFPLSPDTRLQMIAVDDIGVFTAMAFDRPGHWQGRTVELAGDELSMTELADAFSRMAGREVRYNQVPWDAFEQQVGHEMAVMFRWFERVGYHVDIPALRQEYPNLTGFERWLQSNWSKTLVA